MKLIFEQIRVGGDRNFGYLVADRDAGLGVIVDPAYSPESLVNRAQVQGLTITHVVNTHGHPDHTNGNDRAVELTGAAVAAHPESPVQPSVELADGAELKIGSLKLKCLEMPGQCPGHVILYEPTYQFLYYWRPALRW